MSMAFQLLQFPLPSSSSVVLRRRIYNNHLTPAEIPATSLGFRHRQRRRYSIRGREHLVLASKEETTELSFSLPDKLDLKQQEENKDEDGDEEPPTPEDLENVRQIQRVLALLKKNRDMLFSEVKLTISIEDPRELERRRLLGIEDPDSPTREDLADALEMVNEGKVPADRVALQLLAEEMINWPNVEVELKKTKPSKSLYAKATDTGVNPQVAAKRLNVDWDSAATINNTETGQETDVPAALGFGALYLVSAFPIIIDPKLDTVMKNETAHKAKQRPKEEQNSNFRESSSKKGCHCLALRPEMLQIKNPDTETAHKAKRRSKEEQNSESRESSVKKWCPCLAIRPGVTSRKVFSVCSSLSANHSNTHKQKRVNQGLASPVQSKKPENWHSPRHYLHALQQESYLQKSKSHTEDRPSVSSDEKIDFSTNKINQIKPEMKQQDIFRNNGNLNVRKKGITNKNDSDEKFKCTLTCLYLPNFSKVKPKPVRPPAEIQQSAISRTVSLERFECKSSWSSAAVINDTESDGESMRLYFDLPVELIRATFNDASSPVATAFVFDKDRKEGLKNISVREKGTKSHEAGRHVRFSTSSLES